MASPFALTPPTPEQIALERWRSQWPWQALPALQPGEHDIQVFVRLDFTGDLAADPPWQPWQVFVTLNGQAVCVPFAADPHTRGNVGFLPVPTPHVTIRRWEETDPASGIRLMRIAVTTEGGA